MTQEYVTVQRVTAWAAEQKGQAGYHVEDSRGVVGWQSKQAFEASHVPMGHTGHLTADQRDVVAQKALNDDQVIKLTALLETDRFRGMNSLERQQVQIQLSAASLLANVLADRVDDFTPAPAAESAAK